VVEKVSIPRPRLYPLLCNLLAFVIFGSVSLLVWFLIESMTTMMKDEDEVQIDRTGTGQILTGRIGRGRHPLDPVCLKHT
jgi:hypothetical protein